MPTFTNDDLKTLCDYDKVKQLYVQKQGTDYIENLSKLVSLDNKNDKPFTLDDLKQQPELSSFKFKGKNDFIKICTLRIEPLTIDLNNKRKNEKIVAFDFTDEHAKHIFNNSLGVAYMLTCMIDGSERIIKIGQTRNTFNDRLSSYNCGCIINWRTASTTNLKLKQSMVVTRIPINLYIYDCQKTEVFEWHGVKSAPFASPFSLAVEDIMIKEFIKQYGKKPLINIQANATNNNLINT